MTGIEMGGKMSFLLFLLSWDLICFKKQVYWNEHIFNINFQIAYFVLFFQILLKCLHEIFRMSVFFFNLEIKIKIFLISNNL